MLFLSGTYSISSLNVQLNASQMISKVPSLIDSMSFSLYSFLIDSLLNPVILITSIISSNFSLAIRILNLLFNIFIAPIYMYEFVISEIIQYIVKKLHLFC